MTERWKWIASIAATAVFGSLMGAVYTRQTQPTPGLRASGFITTFAPSPPTSPTTTQPLSRIGPTSVYWHLTVINNGTKTASDIRLRFPATSLVQVGDHLDTPPSANQFLAFTDLHSLLPGDQVVVDGWSTVGIEPSIDAFSLSHSDGYGTVQMSSRTQHQSWPAAEYIKGYTFIATLLIILWTLTRTWPFTSRKS